MVMGANGAQAVENLKKLKKEIVLIVALNYEMVLNQAN